MMDGQDRQRRIGAIGEIIAQRVLGGIQSKDSFDMEKDLVLEDGTEVEVKAQVRWRTKDVFTIYESPTDNNLGKCLRVQRLIFVEPSFYGSFRIFECTDRTYSVLYPAGFKAYAFPASRMHLIDEVVDRELWQEFIDLTKTPMHFLA